jgi:hypothetical protein
MLRRIAVLLGILLAAWALLALLHRSSADRPAVLVLPRLTAPDADSFSYVGPQDTIRVVRQGGTWRVNGTPAAAKVVETFFRAMADTSARSELVAQSPASHERLGVDSLKGKRLTVVKGGKPVLDLWFGNRGPDFEGFYVRRAGENQVYLLRGTFADLTVQPLDDWRDRQILAVGPDTVSAVEVVRGRVRYSLKRAGTVWNLAQGGTADSTKVARFLRYFADLRATGFPSRSESDSARFRPAKRQVTLFGASGQQLATLALDSLASGFLVRAADSGPIFKLDARTAELITPEAGSLEKRER